MPVTSASSTPIPSVPRHDLGRGTDGGTLFILQLLSGKDVFSLAIKRMDDEWKKTGARGRPWKAVSSQDRHELRDEGSRCPDRRAIRDALHLHPARFPLVRG